MEYIDGFDAIIGVFGIIAVILFVVLIPILVLYYVGLWKLFKKAGKNGWEAIIPFYGSWVLVEISGLNWWYFLLIIANSISVTLESGSFELVFSIANLVGSFFCYYNIAKKLHKDVGFAVLMTLFPGVMIPLVGLSNSFQYDNTVVVSENGPIAGKNDASYSKETTQNNSYYNDSTVNTENTRTSVNNFCPNCGNKLEENAHFCGICGNKIF